MVSMKTTSTVRQLRAIKRKKRPPKCKACKYSHKDCPRRTGRGTTTSNYTPIDVKSDPEHISDEELTSSGGSA